LYGGQIADYFANEICGGVGENRGGKLYVRAYENIDLPLTCNYAIVFTYARLALSLGEILFERTHTHTHTCTRTPQNQPRARRPGVSRRRTKAGKIRISNRGVIVTRATRLLPTVCSEKKKTDIIKERKRCVRKSGEKPRPRIIESRLSAGLSRDH